MNTTLPDPRYTIAPDGGSITCGRCGLTSHNPHDVQHRYCANCKAFHDDRSVEFECSDCGRHIFQFGGPLTRKCAACTAIPGWFRDPDLARRIDPEMHRNPPPSHRGGWDMTEHRVGKLRDTRMPECRCPWCGHRLDGAMAGDPKYPDATPKPGDVSVCISCAQILVFTDDLTLRASMPGEIVMTPVLRRAQEAVRALDRRKMRL